MEAGLREHGLLNHGGYSGPIGRFFRLASRTTGDVGPALDLLMGRLRAEPDATVVLLVEREELLEGFRARSLDGDALAALACAYHATGDSRLEDLDLEVLTAPRFRMVRRLLQSPAPEGTLQFTRAYWFNQWSGAFLDPHLGP